jgi:NADH:ubiquinone oxidoreductase subunit E
VECLASCGTAPVMMCNDAFYEGSRTSRRIWGVQMSAA